MQFHRSEVFKDFWTANYSILTPLLIERLNYFTVLPIDTRVATEKLRNVKVQSIATDLNRLPNSSDKCSYCL